MNDITYINRETGKKEQEAVPAGKTMRFIYGSVLGKLSLWLFFKRKFVSAIGGWYMNSATSKKKIAPFIEEYNMDMTQFIEPKNGFKHFNDFFYRKIKPEKRPIGNGIVSPADGRVLAFNTIHDTQDFFIKGTAFNLSSFLNDETLAAKYNNGSMFIVRLAPVDYHRYHFPITGIVSKNHKINGAYYSVSPIALNKSLKIFCENKREFSIITNEQFGNVLFMDVGATMTGSIIQTHEENSLVYKGNEKGYFAFGGSTIVLLFEQNTIKFSQDIVTNTKNGFETLLKMGETIGTSQNE